MYLCGVLLHVIYIFICVVDTVYIIWLTLYDLKSETLQSHGFHAYSISYIIYIIYILQYKYIIYILQKLFVIHEGNTKQISTMTVTLHLIKRIDVRKILYKI